MGQCCAREREHWEDGQQFQPSVLCNLAVQKLPFLCASPTCKIWCCLKIIYVQAQKECDELHWEKAKLGKQATPLRMKLNLDKHNIKHIERNDLSYKYTQMVPELASVSCSKELDCAANSSQSAQRLGK